MSVRQGKSCTVPDQNGVLWAVAEDDVQGWVGNKEYAVIREGAKRVKVKDPNIAQEKRNFKGANPHTEAVWEKRLVRDEDGEHEELVMQSNPLWEEWEASKAAHNRMGVGAAIALCTILLLVIILLVAAFL
jgi:hypothetical protein